MRGRKKLLGLPADHFWVMSDWDQLTKTAGQDGAGIAAQLQLRPEEVKLILPEEWREHIFGGPLPVSDLQIAQAVVETEDKMIARVLGILFSEVFGMKAEEAMSAWAEPEDSTSQVMPPSLQPCSRYC